MSKFNKLNILNNNRPPLLIAEISCNHAGSKNLFLKHILSAHKNGADLVKIQTYEPNDMVVSKNFKIKDGLWKGKKLYNLYKKACTPYSWHKDAFKLAKKNNINLFSTPFSIKSLEFLKKFKPNLYKISSFEITDLNLIMEVAKTKKPIIISTGLATNMEIRKAVNVIKRYHDKIILMYCVSGYPTPLEDVNFKRFAELKKIFKVNLVGFSDHTKGILASTVASSYNIAAIEKHFILDKGINSEDKKFSITPDELNNLKINIHKVHKMMFSKSSNSEKKNIKFRRSIYAIKDIEKGDVFSKENIQTFRPKIGIDAALYNKVVGKKVIKKIKKNDPIKLKFFK